MASLWDRTQKLPKEDYTDVERVYGEHFPLEVRFQLAKWMEENLRPGLKMDDFSNQDFISLAFNLLTELDATANAIPEEPANFLTKKKLRDCSMALRLRYNNNPAALTRTMKHCLDAEASIVARAEAEGAGLSVPSTEATMAHQIRNSIGVIKQKVLVETMSDVNRVKQENEALNMDLYTHKELSTNLEKLKEIHGDDYFEVKKLMESCRKMKEDVGQKLTRILSHFRLLENKFKELFEAVKGVQVEVLENRLASWKREQQLSGNGFTMKLSLDVIQVKYLRGQIAKFPGVQTQSIIPEILAGVTGLLTGLVTGTFIIEKQPPQVMKTNTRFTATVRLLVGGQLNVHMASPNVSVSIISESQCLNVCSGEILNGNGNMEYHVGTRQVSVTFRNLQLKRIRRTEKRGTESVMEEKFSVCFWTDFTVGELNFQVFTLSLPVVVIVHGNQEPQALATITWDNAFAEWGRRPFVVPDKVPWFQMAEALNSKWTDACKTNQNLTEENFYFLATKAFRNPNLGRDEIKNLVISWSQFCREPLPDRNFTFWEWFYRVMCLTSSDMRGPWNDGLIMGFVSKQKAEELLLGCPHGTFLLRYSDSELGGVTIAYVCQDQMGGKNVLFVAPFVHKDLSQRSIADTIFDLKENLTALYPNIPCDVFKKFSASSKEIGQTSHGYVPHSLKTHVQGPANEYSNPTTPLNPYEIGYEGSGYPEDVNGMDYDIAEFNIQEILNISNLQPNMFGGGMNQQL
ncbi:signal transducer and activator of transcription 5A [Eurytemora carolleeae]|uniref:signal transducer and activator of transcription 5A n=1 Tax=Eurytemora carolleeae TaxID=1294199 RepID=UPI000C776C40|nr:signal transducer and activator of transcription 5A [Eurytemora carolleeae]|eukprot:XP_023331854.1 signal transducer and activator of transcription 5A-like [Eurytemora affinis]